MRKAQNVPLSVHARLKLLNEHMRCFFTLRVMFSVAVVAPLLIVGDSLGYPLPAFLGGLALAVLVLGSAWRKYSRAKQVVLADNAHDHERSQKLHTALEQFGRANPLDFPVEDGAILGKEKTPWKPYRVEHFVSSTVRGELEGEMRGFAFFVFRGHLRGTVEGVASPNLLETSTVIFLRAGDETLRVLMPSPRGLREILTATIKRWCKNLPKRTYTRDVLSGFSKYRDPLAALSPHADLIDSLDLSCEKPIEERPEVVVHGELLAPGLAFATILEAGEMRKTLVPSGFFKALTEGVSPILGQLTPPQVTDAVTRPQ